MSFETVSPGKVYVTKKDGVVKVKSVSVSLSVANDQTVIAAVSGKRIRVLAYRYQSSSATQGAFALKNGSGGSTLDGGFAPPLAGLPMLIPAFTPGYFETSVGVGLFADVVTGTVSMQVYYVEYTP